MRIMRQIDQHAAGHADLREQPSALGAQGSLTTWTMMVCPSNSSFSIGVGGSWLRSPRFSRRSAIWMNAARSSPMSMNALCMPGSTRTTAQVNIAYMAALDAALDMQFLHRSCSTSATRVSNGVTLIRMSSLIAVAVGMGRSSPLSWGRLTRRIVNVPPGRASRGGVFMLTKLGWRPVARNGEQGRMFEACSHRERGALAGRRKRRPLIRAAKTGWWWVGRVKVECACSYLAVLVLSY